MSLFVAGGLILVFLIVLWIELQSAGESTPDLKVAYFLHPQVENTNGYAQVILTSAETIFVSGTMSIDDNGVVLYPGDLGSQMGQVYQNLGASLKQVNADWSNVVMETLYTTNITDATAALSVRAHFIGNEKFASSWVQVQALRFPGALIQVDLQALLPSQ